METGQISEGPGYSGGIGAGIRYGAMLLRYGLESRAGESREILSVLLYLLIRFDQTIDNHVKR